MASTFPRERAVSAAVRIYRILLNLYPREFRRQFSEEMLLLFRDKLRDDGRSPSFWKEILADTLVSAVRERRDQMRRSTVVLTLASVAVGLTLAWIDSRPNWDDTGITAASILLMSALFGAAEPETPWLWALAVGSWIPALAIVRSGNYGAILALILAFAGAYIGSGLRRAFNPPTAPTGDRP